MKRKKNINLLLTNVNLLTLNLKQLIKDKYIKYLFN